jgi:Zn-dependent oligopeptidase
VYKPGEESNAIDFLLRVSIPQFSGNSQSEFWNRHVLQLAQQDVATKHALVALAHLHRDFTNSGNHGQHNQPALHHYDTAIRNHIKSLSGEVKNTVDSGSAMTTAIVFICIEIMQGHLASAVSLLQHSVAMLPKSGNQQVHLYEDIISRLQIHARRVSYSSTTFFRGLYIYNETKASR